jgi:hypothetical protein
VEREEKKSNGRGRGEAENMKWSDADEKGYEGPSAAV